MLFAQIAAPATATTGTAAEIREAPKPDTRTTRDASNVGDVKDPNDTRSTREAGYDPRDLREVEAARQRTAQQNNRDFQATPSVRAARASAEEGGGVFRPGGTDYGLQLSLIEGYNDNVVQTQDSLDGPVRRHPSPFTGLDLVLTLRTWTSPTDPHEFQVQLRGQHYEPLENFDQPDDGTVVGLYSGQFSLGKRTTLLTRVVSTVSTLNSSRLSDGPLFLIEPASLQRTFTLTNARMTLQHEITPRLRYNHGIDLSVGTTLRDAPILTGQSRIFHHGLDFVQPGTDGTLLYDFSDSDTGNVRLRYEQNRNYFLLDFTRQPPQYLGVASTHIGEATTGLTHSFSDSLRWLNNGGVAIATPPVLDIDRRPILSPLVSTELLYSTNYWLFNISAAYTYGSASPRLGFGPSISTAGGLSGRPFPHTRGWRNLAVLFNIAATRAAFRTADSVSRITFVVGSFEGRYSINNWLGLLAGYSVRNATFEGAQALPALFRNIFFIGVSGYWNTDRSLPTITTFAAPTQG